MSLTAWFSRTLSSFDSLVVFGSKQWARFTHG
jgi:hypothetical protein